VPEPTLPEHGPPGVETIATLAGRCGCCPQKYAAVPGYRIDLPSMEARADLPDRFRKEDESFWLCRPCAVRLALRLLELECL
jgi:hypothetical protein